MSSLGHLNGSPEAFPDYERGGYVPPSLGSLMRLVCSCGDISVDLLRSHRRSTRLMHLRSIVSVLSAEFHPRITAQTVEDAMLRGAGLTSWHRARHDDRLKAYPEYAQLFHYCRAMVLKARAEHLMEGK